MKWSRNGAVWVVDGSFLVGVEWVKIRRPRNRSFVGFSFFVFFCFFVFVLFKASIFAEFVWRSVSFMWACLCNPAIFNGLAKDLNWWGDYVLICLIHDKLITNILLKGLNPKFSFQNNVFRMKWVEIFGCSVKDFGWIYFFLVQSFNFTDFFWRNISRCVHVCVILLYLLVFSRF